MFGVLKWNTNSNHTVKLETKNACLNVQTGILFGGRYFGYPISFNPASFSMAF